MTVFFDVSLSKIKKDDMQKSYPIAAKIETIYHHHSRSVTLKGFSNVVELLKIQRSTIFG